ncbi:hypothetical protein KHQ81_13010 [Mycoplasmatota bacterium]|nr:hypothetical protein KHQ81_13010 [Mycoplasmatota bacterium]
MIERGSFVTSYSNLGKELRLTVQNIRTSINKLKSTNELTVKTTNKYSIIYIKNYDDYQENNTQVNNQLTFNQQSTNNQLTTTKNDKNDKNEKNDKNIVDYEKIKDYYNKICGEDLKKIKYITDTRKKNIKKRIEQHGKESLKIVIDKTHASDFLSGRNGKWTSCGFDWIIKKENYIKILEGTYDNNPNAKNNNIRHQETVPGWMSSHQSNEVQKQDEEEVDLEELRKDLQSFK